jgi:hypothetical protein
MQIIPADNKPTYSTPANRKFPVTLSTRDHPMILFRMLRHRFSKSPRLEGYG